MVFLAIVRVLLVFYDVFILVQFCLVAIVMFCDCLLPMRFFSNSCAVLDKNSKQAVFMFTYGCPS